MDWNVFNYQEKMIQLRPYQQEAIDALHTHICTKSTNPCIVLPTAAGKSVVMAAMIEKWRKEYPKLRGCILAHRKELVEQNAKKLHAAQANCSTSPIGIFSAGLGKRDWDSPIIFASIDSIYRKSGEFQSFDFLFIDEAHRIPPEGEGKYRTFIKDCQRFNKNLRVVGWTATPFRMGCGLICHPDHILNEVCYEAKIVDLISQGYLCRLRSKVGCSIPDLKRVEKCNGDYRISQLSERTSKVVAQAIAEIVKIINSENRQSVVVFCVDVEHCRKVSEEFGKYGIYAPEITGKTKSHERDKLLTQFKNGKVRVICNVNVLTEGFDAPCIDCIVLLRPTLSPGLFSQMVGRGLRLHNGKQYCLVLDFANCIDEHGPLDLLGNGYRVVMAVCQNCRESFSRAIKICPSCGWTIPKQEVDRLERVEAERRMHGTKASQKNILSSEPETLKVDTVYVARHCKPGSPDSLRVQFRCGAGMYRLWWCLNHGGEIGEKAQREINHFAGYSKRMSVNEVLQDMFLSQKLLDSIKTITVKRTNKHFEIIAFNQVINE